MADIVYPPEWSLDREALQSLQLEKLNQLFERIVPANKLYQRKLGASPPKLSNLDELRSLPTTTKDELIEADERGEQRTFSSELYVRYHQTSGTRGRPLAVLDTAEDWQWWMAAWRHVLGAAQIEAGQQALLAFSFGPFIGFWSAFDALSTRGVRAIPCGGMTSSARLELIQRTGAEKLFCTPSYALRLAEVGREEGIEVDKLSIDTVVVAGEPGGSLAATRTRIEQAWGARVVDHSGATEVGPWGFGDDLWNDPPGLRLIESEFIAEFLDVETGEPAEEGELAHLVITPLGRIGSPVVRYETGDLVRVERPIDGPCRFVRLVGGVVGRRDDMLVVRGVNVFPSSIEQVMRETPGVEEWRMIAERRGEMDELTIEVEAPQQAIEAAEKMLQNQLGLRVAVKAVDPGSLPRTEHKSNRLVDRRQQGRG